MNNISAVLKNSSLFTGTEQEQLEILLGDLVRRLLKISAVQGK